MKFFAKRRDRPEILAEGRDVILMAMGRLVLTLHAESELKADKSQHVVFGEIFGGHLASELNQHDLVARQSIDNRALCKHTPATN